MSDNRELGERLPSNPILTVADVPASDPQLEVVSVFNPAAARVGDEVILLLRVAERARQLDRVPSGARMLDLSSPGIHLRPIRGGTSASSLIGVTFLDTNIEPPQLSVGYLRRDLPGLDLSDPRRIRYVDANSSPGTQSEIHDYLTQLSHLRVARSADGEHFEVDARPAVTATNQLEAYGCEDARATLIDGLWHVTYVSAGPLGITTSRLTTSDFRSFDRHGVMFLPDHKDVVLFPEKVGGNYVALTRPMPASFGRVLGVWIAYSPDLVHWGGHQPLALPRWGHWDEIRTGAGVVPIRVEEGWLELYHGVDRHSRYAMGGLLLDADDPARVIARSDQPILLPTEPYERTGLFNDTVFACGHVSLDEAGRRIRVYYGAADSCVAAADFDVRKIVDQLAPC